MVKAFLLDLLLRGKIPFFPFWQKVLLFSAVVPVVGIFFFPDNYLELGTTCFNLLVVLLAVRPMGDLFPDLRIFRGILPLRKEAGILCASLGIAHSIGYFLINGIPLPAGFFDPVFIDPTNYLSWGMLGFLMAILLGMTSNIFSMRLLKRNWKRLHRLVYVFFFVTVAHVVLIRMSLYGESFWSVRVQEVFVPAAILLVLWVFSLFRVSFSFQKSS